MPPPGLDNGDWAGEESGELGGYAAAAGGLRAGTPSLHGVRACAHVCMERDVSGLHGRAEQHA